MNDFGWMYFAFGLIAFQIIKALVLIGKDEYKTWRDNRFIKAVRVEFPDTTLVYISVASTDRKAINKLKEQIRNGNYTEVPAETDAFRRGDR